MDTIKSHKNQSFKIIGGWNLSGWKQSVYTQEGSAHYNIRSHGFGLDLGWNLSDYQTERGSKEGLWQNLRIKPGEASSSKFSSFEYAYCNIQSTTVKKHCLYVYTVSKKYTLFAVFSLIKKILKKKIRYIMSFPRFGRVQ